MQVNVAKRVLEFIIKSAIFALFCIGSGLIIYGLLRFTRDILS